MDFLNPSSIRLDFGIVLFIEIKQFPLFMIIVRLGETIFVLIKSV